MTVLSDEERAAHEIKADEDEPLEKSEPSSNPDKLSMEKSTEPGLEIRKFSLGSTMLGACLVLMMICVFISLAKPGVGLTESAFEAFKLIVMTILGYIFGSNSNNGEK